VCVNKTTTATTTGITTTAVKNKPHTVDKLYN